MEYTHVIHTFAPVYDGTSNVLVLGSLPSVKSRENNFYYGHAKNRFWKVAAGVCGAPVPETVQEKRAFLLENHIAVWDVIASCDIMGSSDSSIKNVEPNDISVVLRAAPIQMIFCNGGKAFQLFVKYCRREGMPPVKQLPSTSPANASWTLERLTAEWKAAFDGIGRQP